MNLTRRGEGANSNSHPELIKIWNQPPATLWLPWAPQDSEGTWPNTELRGQGWRGLSGPQGRFVGIRGNFSHTPNAFLQPLAPALQQIHLGLQLSLLVLQLLQSLPQLPNRLQEAGMLLPALLQAQLGGQSSFLEHPENPSQSFPKSETRGSQGPRATLIPPAQPHTRKQGCLFSLGSSELAHLPPGFPKAPVLGCCPSPEPRCPYISFQPHLFLLILQQLPPPLQGLLL